MLQNAAGIANVRAMVPTLHASLRPPPEAISNCCKSFYSKIWSENDPNMALKNVEVDGSTSLEDTNVVRSYRGTHNVSIETSISGCPH